MNRKSIYLAAGSGVLVLGLAVAFFVNWKKDKVMQSTAPKISVLLKGTLREAQALETILANYAKVHKPLTFEIFHQSAESEETAAVPFSLVMADLETLASLDPMLASIDKARIHEKLKLEPKLLKSGQATGIALYEHRYMALYYDKRKVTGKFSSWAELALALRPHTNRLQHTYGLAIGEDVEHSLPFFSAIWAPQAETSQAKVSEGYADLTFIRHAIPVVPLDCAAPCADGLFAKGQAAMALTDDRQLDAFASALGVNHLGIMPLPSGKAARLTQYVGFAAGSKDSDHKASMQFVQYLYSKEGQNEILREFRSIPSLALQSEVSLDEPLAAELIEYLRQSTVSLTVSDRAATIARIEPGLKPYLGGSIGETEASLALLMTEEKQSP